MDNFTKLPNGAEEVDFCLIDFSRAFGVVNHHVISQSWSPRSLRVNLELLLANEVPAPNGVTHGSVIGPVLFLVMAYDLTGVIRHFCFLFADDTKIGGNAVQREDIQADLFAVY